MLNFMRRQSTRLRWVWVLLIFIFSVTLITLYIPIGDLGSVSLSSDVASVGGEKISAKEFQTSYRTYIDRMRSQLSPEMLKAFRFDRQILDSLVSRKVMMEEAKRLGLSVTAAEIEQKILDNPIFREGGNFIGLTRYQQILQQNNMTVDDFESAVRDDLMMEKLRSFIGAGVAISDKEVEEEYRKRNEKVKLDYLVVDPSKLESKVTVSDQDQKDYYEKNQAKYTVPEKRQARYIYLETLKQRALVTVSEDEMRQYYSEHQSEYNLPDRVTAQHILFKTTEKKPEEVEVIRKKALDVLARVKKGEDFAALAKQFSEDGSAATGGDLGSFTRGTMVPEFDASAFSLGVGAISDLVTTQFGFHIIKVNDRQVAKSRPFEDLKGAIMPIVSTRKAEARANEEAQKIAVDLMTNKDLKAVADKHGAEVRDTPAVEVGGAIPELGSAAALTQKMFAMNKGDIGTSIQVERGYLVPQLTEIFASHPATFEEAKTQVLPEVKAEKARLMATEQGTQVQALIKAGKDLAAVAKAVGAEVKISDPVARGGFIAEFGSLTDIEKEIFSLAVGKAGTPSTVAGKTLAYVVKEHQEIVADEMKKALDGLRGEMLPAKKDQYFQAYIQEARKRMEDAKQITINDAVLAQVVGTIG